MNKNEKFYNCPKCNSRHSIDAWEYKTRKELEIDDIDSTDIQGFDDDLGLKYKYFCPTCHQSSIKLKILQHDLETQALRLILSNMIEDIRGTEEHLELFNQEKVEYFVHWEKDEIEWVVSNSIDEHEFVGGFESVSETVRYLLQCGVSVDLNTFDEYLTDKSESNKVHFENVKGNLRLLSKDIVAKVNFKPDPDAITRQINYQNAAMLSKLNNFSK